MSFKNGLKYSLYVIFHPFDGFWCLKKENKRNFSTALFILLLLFINGIFGKQFLGYYFRSDTTTENINIFLEMVNAVLPIFLWSVSNWCFTTLMDGEGSLKDIFYATIYAYLPIVLLGIPLTLITNILIPEEGTFYTFFYSLSYLWTGFLVFVSSLVIHKYEFLKNILVCIFTIIGMGIIIFIGLLFYNLIIQFVSFVTSIYTELVFHM